MLETAAEEGLAATAFDIEDFTKLSTLEDSKPRAITARGGGGVGGGGGGGGHLPNSHGPEHYPGAYAYNTDAYDAECPIFASCCGEPLGSGHGVRRSSKSACSRRPRRRASRIEGAWY